MRFFSFSNFNIKIQWLVVMLIAVILLFFRDADPLFSPVMYTEDGQWTGKALSYGWLYTLYNAKEGYLVWGNLLLLWLASTGSSIACNDTLICLPKSLAIISYLFFAFIAALSFFATKSYLKIGFRVLLFFLFLLMPMGDSANEIIGRSSNIGYYFIYITLLLILVRDEILISKLTKFFIDILLLLGVVTNPVCIPIISLYMLYSWFPIINKSGIKTVLKENFFLILGFCSLVVLVVIKQLTMTHSGVTGSLKVENLTEVLLARSILYPFVFQFYQKLNGFLTVFLFLAWLTIIFFGLFASKSKMNIVFSFMVLIIYLAFTIFMRQSLTEQLGSYRTTFPDRYFMGLNILVVFITVLALNGIYCFLPKLKNIVLFLIALLTSMYVWKLNYILEYDTPRFIIKTEGTFSDRLCIYGQKNWSPVGEPFFIPIYFEGWFMELPYVIVNQSIKKLDCELALRKFLVTDQNWEFGLRKGLAVFFVSNSSMSRNLFSAGRGVKFKNGEVRKILKQEPSGKYLNVYFEGEPLKIDFAGAPDQYEVVNL